LLFLFLAAVAPWALLAHSLGSKPRRTVPVWGVSRSALCAKVFTHFFWTGAHGPLNENRVMGFYDVFMTLFTPRQTTQNKTVFIERWSDYKKQCEKGPDYDTSPVCKGVI